MTELTAIQAIEPDYPSYKDVGTIWFEIEYLAPSDPYTQIGVIVHDHCGCAFWIAEGQGIDYWIDQTFEVADFIEGEFYVIENIVGHYHKGDWGFDDDDEEFESDPPRLMTAEERKLYATN